MDIEKCVLIELIKDEDDDSKIQFIIQTLDSYKEGVVNVNKGLNRFEMSSIFEDN